MVRRSTRTRLSCMRRPKAICPIQVGSCYRAVAWARSKSLGESSGRHVKPRSVQRSALVPSAADAPPSFPPTWRQKRLSLRRFEVAAQGWVDARPSPTCRSTTCRRRPAARIGLGPTPSLHAVNGSPHQTLWRLEARTTLLVERAAPSSWADDLVERPRKQVAVVLSFWTRHICRF